jgi:hypothetical protein
MISLLLSRCAERLRDAPALLQRVRHDELAGRLCDHAVHDGRDELSASALGLEEQTDSDNRNNDIAVLNTYLYKYCRKHWTTLNCLTPASWH